MAFLCNGSRHTSTVINAFRLVLGLLVFLGSLMTIDLVWALVDFCMVIMTTCNLIAILILGRYALRLLDDYQQQRRAGKNPTYHSSTCPDIAGQTTCWDA